ncbi:pyocin activator PrtN family protein [Serratia sarumanii]|uniref:pyocin activator PrtN family protein n=1 Tax=Serratia sarumanii TaxID=3020826 RepID=UPI003F8215C2
MNRMFLLMAEFETSDIPLEKIAEKYLGISIELANKRANAGKLPIPSFRAVDSNKAPRLVHVKDLADYLDQRTAAAREEFKQVNS